MMVYYLSIIHKRDSTYEYEYEYKNRDQRGAPYASAIL